MNFVTVDEVGEVEEEEEEKETTKTRGRAKKRTRQTPGNTNTCCHLYIYTVYTVMSKRLKNKNCFPKMEL